ncbi:uncharacterized protein LOC143861963 [Tasmannia lanceolata]|uniref:uncharacterized protein LOC143861963 n=1 Tax=Tasmannia lanceolata TaxID=3420 RepID=UPI00406406D1
MPNSTGISVHSIINIDYSEESHALLHSITAIESRMLESSIADSRKRTREETLFIGNASKEGEVLISTKGKEKKTIPQVYKEIESDHDVLSIHTNSDHLEVQSSIEEYSTGASQEITRDDALLIANTCKEGEVLTSMEGKGKKSIAELQIQKESLCTDQHIQSDDVTLEQAT